MAGKSTCKASLRMMMVEIGFGHTYTTIKGGYCSSASVFALGGVLVGVGHSGGAIVGSSTTEGVEEELDYLRWGSKNHVRDRERPG